jgi:hypothetical protein
VDDSEPTNEEALTELIAELHYALSLSTNPDHPNNPERAHPDRLAAITALAAVLDFLETIPGARKQGLKQPLQRLLIALTDFEEGKTSVFFVRGPWQGKGRAPESREYIFMKANAAAAMQFLMRSGKKRQEAATLVARWLDARGHCRRGRAPSITWRTVAGWRDEAKAGSGQHDLITDLYRHAIGVELGDMPYDKAARTLTDKIPKIREKRGLNSNV